ncbi:transcription termination/antitermination protein NusA [Candidatus Parcubacteria bacterium]|jgi:N utilization substance protein A|nr:MAG: transcription termination/antitermination protein NusA [Candidatus Parcubacteria bacterium]
MSENPIIQAMKQITEEKRIPMESVIHTVEAALAVAYRKDFGSKEQNIKVDFNLEDGSSRVFDVKTVVEDEKKIKTEAYDAEKKARLEAEEAEREAKVAAGETIVRSADEKPVETQTENSEKPEEVFERFDPKTEITLTDASSLKPDAKIGDVIRTELFPPAAYGRMAAQTAKQVIIQQLREAEREIVFQEYKDKEGEMINATVQRQEGKLVIFDIGHTMAIMPPQEQLPTEQYRAGARIKVFIVSVNATTKGPEIIVSRTHPEMVRKLFATEVPEIQNNTVEIKAVAREAGYRSKIAVASLQPNIDPIGSCVGQRGSRVQTVINELGGEKIDIIEWSEDPIAFIGNALSPAKVISINLDEENHTARVEVKEDQLSLAIGKSGQNVRLAAKLTGWRIDIVGEGGKTEKTDKPADAEAEKKEESETKTETEKPAEPEPEKTETPLPAEATPAEPEKDAT